MSLAVCSSTKWTNNVNSKKDSVWKYLFPDHDEIVNRINDMTDKPDVSLQQGQTFHWYPGGRGSRYQNRAQGAEKFNSSESIKTSLKCNHTYSFPLKTSFAMHLCKFVTVHYFKAIRSFCFRSVSLRAPLFWSLVENYKHDCILRVRSFLLTPSRDFKITSIGCSVSTPLNSTVQTVFISSH